MALPLWMVELIKRTFTYLFFAAKQTRAPGLKAEAVDFFKTFDFCR